MVGSDVAGEGLSSAFADTAVANDKIEMDFMIAISRSV